MSREIKFRAWSIKDNSYINGCNMYGFVLGQGAPKEILERYDSKWKKGEFLLEQFTGLKDKNGKEIYEGDKIIYGDFAYNDIKTFGEKPWDNLPDGVKEDDITRVREELTVEWDYILLAKIEGFIMDNPDVAGIEVIGNIHENPELLNKELT